MNSGLGYEDDLTALTSLKVNDIVKYVVVPIEGSNANLTAGTDCGRYSCDRSLARFQSSMVQKQLWKNL